MVSSSDEKCFISLGCDCSVSYHLRRLGMQTRGSMPFDWMRIDKLASVISILEAGFQDFTTLENYIIKPQSVNAFAYQGLQDGDGGLVKSHNKMTHAKYKFTLPHEYRGAVLDTTEFQEKYSRRIARFLKVGRSAEVGKVFVRLGSIKECGGGSPGRGDDGNGGKLLNKTLDGLGIVNYEIKYIYLEEWEHLIAAGGHFTWQRDYIPWEKILILE